MQNTMAKTLFDTVSNPLTWTALACALLAGPALSQNFPITAQQRATATEVAQSGVALSELSPNAPQSYTVKSGDTLWDISGLFLKKPWRWPELWGMNLSDIKNPHLIYPGQVLFLDTSSGRARLSMRPGTDLPTVRVSPRTRIENLASSALPALRSDLIEAFLTQPLIVDEQGLNAASRIVAVKEDRVLLTRGDRAYARSADGSQLQDDPSKKQKAFRVFRDATPLVDPASGEVLGFEAQYVGKALLARSESVHENTDAQGKKLIDIVPATIDIIDAKKEMRVGDRLLPEPPLELQSYVPHAPANSVEARVVSIYGDAVSNAAKGQVVSINRGSRDGIELGHVLAIMTDGARLVDPTDAARPVIKLPDERNGLLMVFRTFDRVSYGLVLDMTSGVKVGDRLVNPR